MKEEEKTLKISKYFVTYFTVGELNSYNELYSYI